MVTLKSFSACVCVLLLAAIALGQGGAATGDLHITVKDPHGSAVSNATVTVRDPAKGLERTATSDNQGGYSAQLLPPGTYTVTVAAAGFTRVENSGVAITVGGLVDLPVMLSVAGGKEVVEVSAQGELVETSRSSTTDTIGQRRIDNLPINGRNYINFTLTDSQVVHDAAPNLGAAPTSGLNMSGQRGRSNLVNVDGTDATDNSVNGVRSTVSQEAVQEFQIITNNYAAEYGRASGGVVNIITRSGSNDFHGDVYGYLRNRSFQAVNPFSTVPNPAYTRVQAGTAFGGALKKDKTFYYFSYEITRRHETGFSSIGANNFGLVPFDTTRVGLPYGVVPLTTDQIGFLTNPNTLAAEANPAVAAVIGEYAGIAGASSGQAVNGVWPAGVAAVFSGGATTNWAGFPSTCTPKSCPGAALFPTTHAPGTYLTLASQTGNFPVFEGTSLYSLRIDHNLTTNNRVMLRVNVSPSTVTGIEVSGQDQPFGQNAYSRTSEQTYRDVAGTVQDTWTIGTTKINEFRFQYARRGLSYFYNTQIPAGSYPAVNIPGFAYFGREPYSYIQRTEQRYQFTDNFSWSIGRHNTKFGVDVNYLPLSAIFTVNYGGVYDIGSLAANNALPAADFALLPASLQNSIPGLSPVQAYGFGVPIDFIQGLGSPSDRFTNIPIGVFWQDSWRVNSNITLNFGVRYDVEIPPKFKPPQGLALPAYNLLGLQKGIQTDKNNIQPRIGIAVDPKGDGKTVVRASYGMFYDHPLLGLYFLGDASDGSSSGQLAFAGTGGCTGTPSAGNLNGVPIFQGLQGLAACAPSPFPQANANLGYLPNQQQFTSLNFPQSVFLNQNYLNLASTNPTFLPLGFQPFGYPQAKNFVYAYAQQANVTVERDLGHGFALSLAYNFNGGRHLNRPINANTVRGDLLTSNFEGAFYDAKLLNNSAVLPIPSSPFTVSGCNPPGGPLGPFPFVDAALMNFFRPGGLNPSIAAGYYASGGAGCVTQAIAAVHAIPGFNTACNPAPPAFNYTGCVPFGDMDANYSNGSSIYHGFTTNLRKRFGNRYEFLASYTWSHAIDDSTDLQSTLTPQDSYYPGLERSSSLFDQRHRFVFSGVYQTGHLRGSFGRKFLSDWTFAPVVDFSSGRPFNIITGIDGNFQLSSLTGRPNTAVNPACGSFFKSRYSPSGAFQAPCINGFVASGTAPTLLQLDGNLGRNAGITPWTVFNDLRVSKQIFFGERINTELIVDMFNIANKMNVAAVSPLFSNAGQATAAWDPRQFQFALKLNW
jgi:Carboxypeptidase regulatory-like domain/TonB dependent receptor